MHDLHPSDPSSNPRTGWRKKLNTTKAFTALFKIINIKKFEFWAEAEKIGFAPKKIFGNFDGGAKVGTGRRFWRQGAFERERRERECVRVCVCVCVGVRDCKIEGGRENVWMCV